MSSLITITTCNRLDEVKKFIWDYLVFAKSNKEFDFLLALDGYEKEYIDFTKEHNIPLLYSDKREGVGLSKNRVLSKFTEYDYYFFIEDDIELIDETVFSCVIDTHLYSGVHHFCNHHDKNTFKTETVNNISLKYCWTGGAQFAFYSREGIEKVGGFHTLFAEYKRYGHTEHSYRYYHQDLEKAPFIFSDSWLDCFLIHSPPQVTKNAKSDFTEMGLISEEQELINRKNSFFPLRTISKFHFNEKAPSNEKDPIWINKKYPFTTGKKRKMALAEHYALRIPKAENLFQKIQLFFKSAWFGPTNIALKHMIKKELFGKH